MQLSKGCIMAQYILLPKSTLYDSELLNYIKILQIPNFRGVKMRDELPAKPQIKECGILNLNKHTQSGSHWTCWYKSGQDRFYFDSYGERPPLEIERYLKTKEELENAQAAIKRSAVTVQHDASNECGALCLYVLYNLSNGQSFPHILGRLEKRYYTKTKTPPLIISITEEHK